MSVGSSKLRAKKQPMNSNPVLKPKVATPALILASTAVVILVAYFGIAMATNLPPNGFFILGELAVLAALLFLGILWLVRTRRRHVWMVAAEEKWRHFDDARRTHGTTTEITVLGVDVLEPTGSWITIKWNRFEHVQQAWIEALPEALWRGSVLLITPDPEQIRPGAPWPRTYYIGASNCLAWAPPLHANDPQKLRWFPAP
jgi:ABC-type nickel/cobalt efflux system permease component RcnA